MSDIDRTEHPAAKTDDIAHGEALRVEIGEREIAIFNLGGVFYATSDTCTHSFASLADGFIEDDCVECPLHGGRFDIKTGAAIEEPCTEDLEIFPVRVDGGTVFVAVPAD
ncbi:MAG: non-heme iron oxygenase ferredoxin subunit [Alphaproteobacteria bacterium]